MQKIYQINIFAKNIKYKMSNIIDLEFYSPKDNFGTVKATVHKTGKLGFSSGAAKMLELEKKSFFNIGFNKSNSKDKELYLLPVSEKNDNSFRLIKAGLYYYIYIKNVLIDLHIDYRNESIIYDIEEIEIKGEKCYKMIRRKKNHPKVKVAQNLG